MANGKISQFLKDNWRACLFASVILVGIFCGVWACSQSTPIDIDANRNRVVIQLSKLKSK